ncbi:MAG TPA: class I SAM-dependent methyltransferase [Vicinamibacterales bacterium]|jgi:malonyl-CoA O-methyltransferase
MTTTLDPRAAYELWADVYPAEAHNPLMAAEEQTVRDILVRISARRALDVGTGSGRYLPILAARVPLVVGVDLSMAMLKAGPASRRVRGDACRLPFSALAFDLVNASLMVGDVSNLNAWTREMARVLSPGGHIVYSDFHPVWSERGWQRTFRTADGVLRAVAFTPHAIESHVAALQASGLSVLTVREPKLTVGRTETPVLTVVHAVKSGGGR